MNHVVAKLPLPPAFAPVRRSLTDLTDQLNPFFQVGPKLASGPAIYPSTTIHHVTGSAGISYIYLPKGSNAGRLSLIADGTWSLLDNGNISVPVGPMNIGDAVNLVYDTENWFPEAGSAAPSPSLVLQPITVNSNYSLPVGLTGYFILVFCGGSDITITLPPAKGSGHFGSIQKGDATAYNVILQPHGSDSMNGNTGGTPYSWNTQNEGYNLMDFGSALFRLW